MNKEQFNGNKLIAEFMGVRPLKTWDHKYSWSDGIFFSCSHDTEEEVMNSICNYVKYSISWDWLMPVVEKIEEILIEDDNLTIKNHRFIIETPLTLCEIYDTISNELVGSGDHGSKILSTHNAVAEFIKWYNKP